MFTDRQRKAILIRDGHKCQAPFPHKCGGRLEVHHCLPQRYSRVALGLTPEEIDRPENALTICQTFHRLIHPDLDSAIRNYKKILLEGGNAFQQMSSAREELLKKHQVYWETKYDRLLLTVAYQRTAKARRKNWAFPVHKIRGTST